MTETIDIVLGGRTFAVPRLPLGVNIEAYPLLRKLNNNGLSERWTAEGPTVEDMADLATIAFHCARAADPALAREEFDALPVAPHELFDAHFAARLQCGAWIQVAPGAGGGGETEPGEG